MMNVSAVVPVYNSVNTLKRAINSLLIQPEINEIIIVDDGSTDGSYEMALGFEESNDLIKVLIHEGRENKGASAARNLGLKYCKNQWVQFLDADDELLHNKIGYQLKLVSENVPFVVGVSKIISRNRNYIRKPFSDIWSGLLFTRLGDTCCNLWNKSYLNSVNGWNNDLINSQDYDLIFRLLKLSDNIKFSPVCSTNIYIQSNSISTNKNFWIQKQINFIKQRVLVKEFLILNDNFNTKRNFYFSAYVGTIYWNYKIDYKVKYSYFLFLLYKIIKSISDRIND
tara:strand:+ start:902 stop:1750 length:849 start_codon:yes stop_codon:yes gene_type:complete